jgi:TolB protein
VLLASSAVPESSNHRNIRVIRGFHHHFQVYSSSLARLTLCALVPSAGAGPEPTLGIDRVHIEPLTGSTGASVTRIIEADLGLAGSVALSESRDAAAIISGTVSGSRLEGRVTDAAGKEIIRTLYDGPDLRRGAHEFADDIVFALTGHPGIATSRIAFSSDRTGKREIYVCDADGWNARRVTYDGERAVHPSLNRTGTLLVYTSYRDGYADVYLLDLIGAQRTKLIALPGTNTGAVFSPDGRSLALCISADGWPVLTVFGLNGERARRLSPTGWLPSSASWTPDGNRVVFSCDAGSGPHLREAKLNGRSTRLDLGFEECYSPDWSPDGQRLIFVSRYQGKLRLALWARGAPRAQLLQQGQDPCWGADSRHVLFSTGQSLVLLDVDTGREHTLIENMGRVSEPAWTK